MRVNCPAGSCATTHQAIQRWPQRPVRKQTGKYDAADTGSLRFHFSNFRYSLTALSRYFASFPHGTCTLSVSHQYLAFDGIYHRLRAAIPNNSTHTCLLQRTQSNGSLTLCAAVFQRTSTGLPKCKQNHNSVGHRFTW